MLKKWLIGVVLNFILRQLEKFQKDIDWGKVKKDLEVRVRDLVPGKWFDDEAVALCNTVIDAVARVLNNEKDIQDILEKIAAQDWVGALEELKDLLLKGWAPTLEGEVEAKALVAATSF